MPIRQQIMCMVSSQLGGTRHDSGYNGVSVFFTICQSEAYPERIDLPETLCHKSTMDTHFVLPSELGNHFRGTRAGRTVRTALAGLGLVALQPDLARADMLSGGLLGSLLRGEDFTGPRLIDLIALGLVIFVLLRLVSGRSKSQDRQQPSQPNRPDPAPDDTPTRLESPPGKPNMYTNAQAAWDYLKTKPGAQPSGRVATADHIPPPADGSPDEQFLAGAKLAYSRILAALTARDFDDLAQFVTPDFLTKFKNRLPETTTGHLDILLVEATLTGQREENGRTVMDVEYKALVREPGAAQNTERHEHWRFTRDNATPRANWLLEEMKRL